MSVSLWVIDPIVVLIDAVVFVAVVVVVVVVRVVATDVPVWPVTEPPRYTERDLCSAMIIVSATTRRSAKGTVLFIDGKP